MQQEPDSGWVAHIAGPRESRAVDEVPEELRSAIEDHAARQLPGPGWAGILDGLHHELVRRDPGYRILQVKEKLGGMRIYAQFDGSVADECHALVRDAETRASRTCERCGQVGRLREDRPWLLTLCDECADTEPPGRPLPTGWSRQIDE
jgi:hypothetical protein